MHLIPNGSVSSLTVTTRDWARAVVDITVPHNVEMGICSVFWKRRGRFCWPNTRTRFWRSLKYWASKGFRTRVQPFDWQVKTRPSRKADVSGSGDGLFSRQWSERELSFQPAGDLINVQFSILIRLG